MRKGAGIKNKLLQAWAMEKAVVATPIACGGLRARPDENIVVARGAAALAARIVALLGDAPRRRRLGAAARDTVLEHYTWTRRSAALADLLQDVAGERGRRPVAVSR
jgi:glycosyltransferase involved in cell wall biosynthesis